MQIITPLRQTLPFPLPFIDLRSSCLPILISSFEPNETFFGSGEASSNVFFFRLAAVFMGGEYESPLSKPVDGFGKSLIGPIAQKDRAAVS